MDVAHQGATRFQTTTAYLFVATTWWKRVKPVMEIAPKFVMMHFPAQPIL